MTSGRVSLVRRIVFGVLGLGLAALVVTVTPGNEIVYPSSGAAKTDRDDPKAVLSGAAVEYVRAHKLSASTYAAARRVAVEYPLASEPFTAVAVEAMEHGQTRRAIALLEAARWRNPRDRFARVVLLEQYTKTGAFVEASEELTTLYRLVPGVGPVLVDTMTKMALDPNGFGPLAKALQGESVVGPLLANMVKTGAPVDRILLLARGMPEAKGPEQTQWREMLLRRLVDEGRYSQARTLWGAFAKLPTDVRSRPFYNLEMARLPASPPFNWDLAVENIGGVDLLARGLASVTYFGRESGPLMAQLLTLSPGNYRFGFSVEGGRSEQGGGVAWRVRCAVPKGRRDAGAQLMEIAIPNDASAKRAFAGGFTVPAGCPAQWLSLDGTSAEFPSTRTLEISGLTLASKDR